MMKSQTIIHRDSDPAGLIARFTMPSAFYKRVNETRFKQEWQLSDFQYWCLRKGWNGEGDPWNFFRFFTHFTKGIKLRKYQRGNFNAFPAGTQALAASGIVVLTTHTKTSSRFSSGSTTARFDFENDGELWGRVTDSGGNSQYAGEWWSREPESGIGSSYRVRNLSAGKTGVFSTQAAADNAWADPISGTQSWTRTRSANGSISVTATYEVGPSGGGAADDSAAMTLTAIMDFL